MTAWRDWAARGPSYGVLLLVSIKDRKIRIEVGYGLEGVLTDARSAQIIPEWRLCQGFGPEMSRPA
ncbi:MAG: TPM domain-containing protein [Nitrospira sp.]|nr:TPM domain-containing protein [Nitrospira sp.]